MVARICSCLLIIQISVIAFSRGNSFIINDIQITGNRTTKARIILRELTFHKGDTISGANLELMISRSRENLLNTSLFNYVTITDSLVFSAGIDITVHVEERWYTWPSVILKYEDRNFSSWLKAKDLSKSEYGVSVEKYNCFGRRETLKFSLLSGYAKQFSLSYRNIALDKNRKHFIGADIEFLKQDEVIYNTINNEPSTFKNSFHPVFERRKFTLNYLFRPYINSMNNFYLNYFEFRISDTVTKLNPVFFIHTRSDFNCMTLDYVYSYDRRDSKAYPLAGSYFEVLLSQTVSVPLLRGAFSSTAVIPNFYKYIKLDRNLYYAAGISLKASFNSSSSFYFSRALGYIYNLHGFEYNTIDGQHFALLRNLLKVAVLNPRVSKLPFIPLKKFNKIHYAVYLNVFADCGYVANRYSTPDNDYANRFLYSGGAGIDIVTYYDRTLRAEYSVNGFGKAGFYFHLTAPINK
jgi:outer membrane protein assembly factor BamA